MKFGFVAHTTNTGQRNQVRAMALLTGERRDHVPVPMLTSVVSPTGTAADGEVRYLPYGAEEMLRRPKLTRDVVLAEVLGLKENGAEIVGLGGATAIVGMRGEYVAERSGIAVTSGNSLTAYAALRATTRAAELLELDRPRAAVVGYPGSIGLVLTKLLLREGFHVDVVHRRRDEDPQRLLSYLPDPSNVTVTADVEEALRRNVLVIGASSAGGVLAEQSLLPGTVVVDVALPRDIPRTGRDDVLVLDGGLVSAAGLTVPGDLPAPTEQLNGCLAETIVLALAGRAECFSLGRELDADKVLEIGALAEDHGVLPAPFASFGRPVAEHEITRLRRYRGGVTEPESTASRFRRRINPPLADLFDQSGLGREFVHGAGSTLTTADGTRYLDFIAAYGALNTGHNHPAITSRLKSFLDNATPSFVQYVSMPAQASELAERLCDLAPGALERVFLSNSGAEAVESALKLARAATGRSKIVYAENSYHGKTFGALSVTGRESYRSPFGPLVPDTVAVPYGDVEALRAALTDAAAFIVEPVQGEGGVVLPPPGYLTRAQELCRSAGAAFVVDEIQTGLGRTGAMFACEHEGLTPDVLCLAKSLSGGLVPIGATLATAEMWDAAYGSGGRALLHTSTFGGGNFAAAAGLATLDVLLAEDLPGRAKVVGDRLRTALAKACAPYDFVGEVRGIGLMNAIAFDVSYEGATQSVFEDLTTRLPGMDNGAFAMLPDQTARALRTAARELENSLGDLLCLRFVAELAAEHRILSFLTANGNQVLRVQPPLVLREEEADHFVDAVARTCDRFRLQGGIRARRAGESIPENESRG